MGIILPRTGRIISMCVAHLTGCRGPFLSTRVWTSASGCRTVTGQVSQALPYYPSLSFRTETDLACRSRSAMQGNIVRSCLPTQSLRDSPDGSLSQLQDVFSLSCVPQRHTCCAPSGSRISSATMRDFRSGIAQGLTAKLMTGSEDATHMMGPMSAAWTALDRVQGVLSFSRRPPKPATLHGSSMCRF